MLHFVTFLVVTLGQWVSFLRHCSESGCLSPFLEAVLLFSFFLLFFSVVLLISS